MRNEVALGLVAATFIVYIFILIPNYQQIAYQNTVAKSYDRYERYVGYPADDNYPIVSSIDEIKDKRQDTFTIKTNASKMEALDFYMDLDNFQCMTNGFARSWSIKVNERIGRFFLVQLESGEEIIVLLDDLTIDLPTKGSITLPIGEFFEFKEGKFADILEEVSGIEEVDFFIDMAGEWHRGEESEGFENVRFLVAFGVFIFLWISLSRIMIRLGEKK